MIARIIILDDEFTDLRGDHSGHFNTGMISQKKRAVIENFRNVAGKTYLWTKDFIKLIEEAGVIKYIISDNKTSKNSYKE